jgi:hypothetical protein
MEYWEFSEETFPGQTVSDQAEVYGDGNSWCVYDPATRKIYLELVLLAGLLSPGAGQDGGQAEPVVPHNGSPPAVPAAGTTVTAATPGATPTNRGRPV